MLPRNVWNDASTTGQTSGQPRTDDLGLRRKRRILTSPSRKSLTKNPVTGRFFWSFTGGRGFDAAPRSVAYGRTRAGPDELLGTFAIAASPAESLRGGCATELRRSGG